MFLFVRCSVLRSEVLLLLHAAAGRGGRVCDKSNLVSKSSSQSHRSCYRSPTGLHRGLYRSPIGAVSGSSSQSHRGCIGVCIGAVILFSCAHGAMCAVLCWRVRGVVVVRAWQLGGMLSCRQSAVPTGAVSKSNPALFSLFLILELRLVLTHARIAQKPLLWVELGKSAVCLGDVDCASLLSPPA